MDRKYNDWISVVRTGAARVNVTRTNVDRTYDVTTNVARTSDSAGKMTNANGTNIIVDKMPI